VGSEGFVEKIPSLPGRDIWKKKFDRKPKEE